MATKEFSTTRRQQIRTATSPYPPDLSWRAVKGRQSLISRVHLPVSLTGPTPPGGADTSRRCQGCSHPPQRLPGQAAPSFTRPLRRSGDEGLSPPLDFRRLVAHMTFGPVIADEQHHSSSHPNRQVSSAEETAGDLMVQVLTNHPAARHPSSGYASSRPAGARSAARPRPGSDPESADPPAATNNEACPIGKTRRAHEIRTSLRRSSTA
jgi:hypothetical protein